MIGKILEKLGLRAVPRWQDVLPLQALTEVNFESAGEVSTGFLSPAAWAASPFARLQGNYPAGSLLGIFPAAAPDAIRRTAMTGNVLHIAADGPRIYDALLLKSGGTSYQAFVVSEGSPDPAKVKRLETDGVIRRTHQGSQDLFFGNFDLAEYGPYLEKIAIEAAEGTHFGNLDKKGRRFLYQTIPGVNLPGKRRVTERAELLRGLMNKAGVSVQDKLVLDVGCNLGLLMSQYLKFGAGWCHGWDFPGVVQHTETMLGALGCTRYSTTGTKIESALPMRAGAGPTVTPAVPVGAQQEASGWAMACANRSR